MEFLSSIFFSELVTILCLTSLGSGLDILDDIYVIEIFATRDRLFLIFLDYIFFYFERFSKFYRVELSFLF